MTSARAKVLQGWAAKASGFGSSSASLIDVGDAAAASLRGTIAHQQHHHPRHWHFDANGHVQLPAVRERVGAAIDED